MARSVIVDVCDLPNRISFDDHVTRRIATADGDLVPLLRLETRKGGSIADLFRPKECYRVLRCITRSLIKSHRVEAVRVITDRDTMNRRSVAANDRTRKRFEIIT